MEPLSLHDANAGTSAKVLPEFGFNCYSFTAVHEGRPREVLWSAPEFASGEERPSGSGIPLLFPFPGRVRGTRFEFDGRSYELEPGDAFGNAIHGFVLNRPWEVIESGENRAVGEFTSSGFRSALADRWPVDFRLTAGWTLEGNTLSCELAMENHDERPLPYGLGLHPYFLVPLSAGGRAEDCRLTVPARQVYELRDMIPTGETKPAEGRCDLSAGKPFSACEFDDVFTDLQFDEGVCTAALEDAEAGRKLSIAFCDAFSHCVIYNPPHREAICIEPYTCVPGMFGENGAAECREVLSILPPGCRADAWMRIMVE